MILGRYDSWRLACELARQQPKEPAYFAELEKRGITEAGIAEMLALASWAAVVTARPISDASDLEAAIEVAQQRGLIDARDLATRRRMLATYF